MIKLIRFDRLLVAADHIRCRRVCLPITLEVLRCKETDNVLGYMGMFAFHKSTALYNADVTRHVYGHKNN